MIGFGHWEYDFKGYNDEANGSRGNKTRLAYAGLKISEFGSLDYGRNYVSAMTLVHGPICCQNLVAIPGVRKMSS